MSVIVCCRSQNLIVQTVSQTAQSHLRVMQLACRGATLTDHERQRIRRSMAATDEFQTLNTCPTLEKWKRAAEQMASSLGFHQSTLFPKDSQIDGLIYFQHYRYSRLTGAFSMHYAPITALITHSQTLTPATKEGRFTALNWTPSELDLIANSVNKTWRNILSSFFKCCNCLFITRRANNGDTPPSVQWNTGFLIRLEGDFNKLKLKLGALCLFCWLYRHPHNIGNKVEVLTGVTFILTELYLFLYITDWQIIIVFLPPFSTCH